MADFNGISSYRLAIYLVCASSDFVHQRVEAVARFHQHQFHSLGPIGLGILGNALGFGVLIYALSNLVDPQAMTPGWPSAPECADRKSGV